MRPRRRGWLPSIGRRSRSTLAGWLEEKLVKRGWPDVLGAELFGPGYLDVPLERRADIERVAYLAMQQIGYRLVQCGEQALPVWSREQSGEQ